MFKISKFINICHRQCFDDFRLINNNVEKGNKGKRKEKKFTILNIAHLTKKKDQNLK